MVLLEKYFNMNKEKIGIVVVAFGTARKDGFEKCIKSITNKVKQKYSEDVEISFTSSIIRKMLLKKENIYINDYKESIKSLYDRGVDKIFVLSLHLIAGKEYDKLKVGNDNIFVSEPLLFEDKDYKKIVENKYLNDTKNFDCLVFMGHGTDKEIADFSYDKLQKEYIDNGKNNIFIGTMDGKIKIFDIIKKLKENEYKKILLKPFLLTTGKHVYEDMASDDENSWKKILESENFEVECEIKGIGEYDFIGDMFLEKLEKIMNQNEKIENEKMMENFYNEISEKYDFIFPLNEMQKKFMNEILENEVSKTENCKIKVLDVGCATGNLSKYLIEKDLDVKSIDINEKLIEKALKKGVIAEKLNMLEIEKIGKKFNLVVNIGNTLPHLNNKDEVFEFLKKSYNILKNKGKLVLQLINFNKFILQKDDNNYLGQLPIIENENVKFERFYYLSKNENIEFKTILDKNIKNSEILLNINYNEILEMLKQIGFVNINIFGGFNKVNFNEKESVFLLITGEK